MRLRNLLYLNQKQKRRGLNKWLSLKDRINLIMDKTSIGIVDFKLHRQEKLKPSSINRDLSALRHIINYAKRDRVFYEENPVTVSGLITEDNLRDRVLSFEEEERLMACGAPHLIPILHTALNTGMRKGEILFLKWDNVDFNNRLFIISASNNKGKKAKKSRLIHIREKFYWN